MLWVPGSLEKHVARLETSPGGFINSQVWDLPEEVSEYALNTQEMDWDFLRANARSHSRWGHGLVLAPKFAYLEVGGLDERMHTYGLEDVDLTKRLRHAGWRQEWAGNDADELFHVWHPRIPDSLRSDPKGQAAVDYNRTIFRNDDSIVRNATLNAPSESPLISIVIATRNRKQQLLDAIYSCLYQSVQNIEVVIVDDGSNDGTDVAVKSVQDSRIRYIRQSPLGISAARNHGTNAAIGYYIAVLDDDDLMLPDRLEVQLQCMTAGVRGCVGNLLNFEDETGELIFHSDAEPTLLGALPTGGFAGHPSWLVEKSLLREIPYDETLTSAIDNNLALRALRSGIRFVHCERFVTLRRRHTEQVTKKDTGNQKTGARLTHMWYRSTVDPLVRDDSESVYWKTAKRAKNSSSETSQLMIWLPDHLTDRQVEINPAFSSEVLEMGLDIENAESPAVSVIDEDGNEIGSPLLIRNVSWPQLVDLRCRAIPHRVSTPKLKANVLGTDLRPHIHERLSEPSASPGQVFQSKIAELIHEVRVNLDNRQYLVTWLESVDEEKLQLTDFLSVTPESFSWFDVRAQDNCARLYLVVVDSLEDAVSVLSSRRDLTRIYTKSALLSLSFLQRKLTNARKSEGNKP
ncbi:hypothetical protein GCM10009824_15070 [Kocuria atrinae]|uniref:Glycosyltransferase 2-like domain-containing protein n=2 Tax=Kocuria atrinae TaxID=592377 RepID=A0ABN2XSE1_9MICC